jgi:hypothetical protein
MDRGSLIDLLNMLEFKYEIDEKDDKIFLYVFFENNKIDVRFLFLLKNFEIDYIDFKNYVIKLSEVKE